MEPRSRDAKTLGADPSPTCCMTGLQPYRQGSRLFIHLSRGLLRVNSFSYTSIVLKDETAEFLDFSLPFELLLSGDPLVPLNNPKGHSSVVPRHFSQPSGWFPRNPESVMDGVRGLLKSQPRSCSCRPVGLHPVIGPRSRPGPAGRRWVCIGRRSEMAQCCSAGVGTGRPGRRPGHPPSFNYQESSE